MTPPLTTGLVLALAVACAEPSLARRPLPPAAPTTPATAGSTLGDCALLLAENFGRGLHIEHVVADLKSEPYAIGEVLKLSEMRGIFDTTGNRAHSNACANQRPGFHSVHRLQFGQRERLPDGLQVCRLTSRHSQRAACLGQRSNHCNALFGNKLRVVFIG